MTKQTHRRDMSWREFCAAAKRNDFKPTPLGLSWETHIFGYRLRKRGSEWKVHHRESLASAIEKRRGLEQ